MELTNEAKVFLQEVMAENNADTLRIVFAGMG